MIDKIEFLENLRLTQCYCDEKIKDSSKNYASILRTINPVISEKRIFDYEIEKFDHLDQGSLILTKWCLNEGQDYLDVVLPLFKKQLNVKKEQNITSKKEYSGRILVSEYECTVTDGASEVAADGLIDIYDLPPIDTWIYINEKEHLLYSWIPDVYVDLINEAVLVNCVDILRWMDIDYKELYELVFKEKSTFENSNNRALVELTRKEKKRKTLWGLFKRK